MRIPLLPWQWTQCPQMWIRRTVRQVTSSFMMAAFTSHRAASSGSCWSNLCCFGYDIDPTHWKERVSEAERERARKSLWAAVYQVDMWTDRMGSWRLRQRSSWRRSFTSLTGSVSYKVLIFHIRHICPSVCLSICLPARWQFLFQKRDSRQTKFRKIPYLGISYNFLMFCWPCISV